MLRKGASLLAGSIAAMAMVSGAAHSQPLGEAFTVEPVSPARIDAGEDVTIEFAVTAWPGDIEDGTISFDLDAVIPGATVDPTSFSASNCGAGAGASVGSTVVFSDLDVTAFFTCRASISATIPAATADGTYTIDPSDLTGTVAEVPFSEPVADFDIVVESDTTGPTSTITGPDGPVDSVFTATVSFTEDGSPELIDGFAIGDLTVTNATAAFTGGGDGVGDDVSSVSLDITPDAGLSDGDPITVLLPAGTVIDQAGNANLVSNTFSVLYGSADPDEVTWMAEFTDDPVNPGDPVTLVYTISNASLTETYSITTFAHDLDAAITGLAASGAPTINTCGGTPSGTTTLLYSGGSVGPGASCTISVPVLVPAGATPGIYAVGSDDLFGTLGSTPFNPAQLAPVLEIIGSEDTGGGDLLFTKEFTDDPVAPGDSVTLEFTITASGLFSVADLAFTDDLDAALSGLVATGLPATDVCGAGSTLSGTSVISLAGGSLAEGGICTFSVTLDVPGGASDGAYVNTTSDLSATRSDDGAVTVSGATDTLDVDGGTAPTPPTVTVSGDTDDLGVGFSRILPVRFSEPVTGLELGDFTLVNAGTATLSGSGADYSLTVTPPGVGTVSVTVPAASAIDDEGTDNLVSNTFTFEAVTPVPEISVTGNGVDITSGDDTPSAADHTSFGSVDVAAGTARRTFTIANTGTGTLSIGGVALGTDYSPESIIWPTIAPGDTMDLVIEFNPSAIGARPATITIFNDDADESPFTFDVTGDGDTSPEINVADSTATLDIVDGDGSPTAADGTDFGTVNIDGSTSSSTFTIENLGSAALTFGATPVTITGSSAYTVTSQPPASIAATSSATFTIEFDPSDISDANATVSIDNSDSDEDPYTFAITGSGLDDEAPSGYSVAFNGDPFGASNNTSVSFTIDDPEILATFDYTISSSGGGTDVTGSGTIPLPGAGDPSEYEVTGIDLSGLGEGTLTLDLTLTDPSGNTGSTASDTATHDVTAPTPVISSTSSPGPVSGAFPISVSFGEAVTGFAVGDLSVGNGSASGFSDDGGGMFSATITPAGDGPVTVDIAASAASDTAGNDSNAATQFSITNDETVPTVSISGPAGPVVRAFSVTFTFSEDVTGFALGDITVGNGTASAFSGSGDTYTATITPAADGSVTVDVAAAVATDDAGNDNTAATQFSVEADITAPTLVINGPFGFQTGAFTVSFIFSEDVTSFTLGDITVGNGSASAFVGSGDSYTATITPAADGTVTIDVAAGVAQDGAGNDNEAASQFPVTADITAPTLAITGPVGPVNGVFTAIFTFSEGVANFDSTDISVGNGVVSGFVVSDIAKGGGSTSALPPTAEVFEATITPTSDGAVTVDVASGAAQDVAGNDNAAASQFSVEADLTAPDVTISGPAGPVSGAFTATFTFTEDVTGFDLSDISARNATASGFSGSGDTYTATITPASDGTVTVDVSAGVAFDNAGNDNTEASQFSVENDETAPTVAISGPSATQTGAFTATFTFSDDVTGFALGDISVGNGSASGFSGSGDTYTVSITPAADGTVTVDVAAGVAVDTAGNGNTAASQFSVEADITAPTVATTGPAGPVSGAFTATFTFSEDVNGFTVDDITVGNGSASGLSGSGDTYTATITPGSDGTVTVDVAAAVATDDAGNDNTAASQFSVENDGTPPTLAITGPTAVQTGAFDVTFTFSEDVTGFEVGDITVGNASVADTTEDAPSVMSGGTISDFSGSGDTYTATITPAADGTVTVDVAAGVAQDAAGNGNGSAPQFSVAADVSAPTVTSVVASDTDLRLEDAGGTVLFTVTFSEELDNSAIPALSFSDDVSGTLSFSSGAFSGSVYTATYTVSDNGDSFADIDVSVSGASDTAGNASVAATVNDVFDIEMRRGSITIAQAVTGSVDGEFDFTGDLGAFSITTVGQAGSELFSDLAEGDYSVVMAVEPDFTLDSISCVGGSVVTDVSTGTATISLSPADAVVCTYTSIADPEVDPSLVTSVSLDLPSAIDDPTSVSTTFDLPNIGGDTFYFTASTDVPWLAIDPTSGSIPAGGSLTYTVSFTAAVLDLAPGTHTATITITETTPPASKDGLGANVLQTIQIPVTIQLDPREGDLTIITTTAPAAAGEGTFTYASSAPAFDGMMLTTVNGTASSTVETLLRGTYTVTQTTPEGWRLDSISCTGDTDGGSTFDVSTGLLTVDLDPQENMVCTFANRRDEDYVREVTMSAIRSFMAARADQILTSSPDLHQRMREDRTAATPNRFMADFRDGRFNAELSTSLSAIRQTAASTGPQMPGQEQFSLAGKTGMESLDIWLEASFTSVDDNRLGLDSETSFGAYYLGMDLMANDDLLVGALIQFDQAETTTGMLRSEVEGDGWMAGPYMVARVGEETYFDARVAWGQSDNEVNPLGLYTDSFETERWMFEANLTGDFHQGAWRISPQAGIAYFTEEQAAYVDTLGFTIPSQEITIGRLSAGPEIAYRFDMPEGGYVEPYAELNVLYDYDDAEVFNSSGVLQSLGTTRADARFGVNAALSNGGMISGEIALQGVGEGDFEANSAMIRVRLPLSMR